MSECFHSQDKPSLLAQLLANLWAPRSNNKSGYQRRISEQSLFYSCMNVPLWLRPSQLQSRDTFEAEMSPTLKLIREAAEQRLTVGGVWMKAESLPGGSSTTARKKNHSTSKHSRCSAVAAPHLHCCLNATRASNMLDWERRHQTARRPGFSLGRRLDHNRTSTTTNRPPHSGGCWVKHLDNYWSDFNTVCIFMIPEV